MTTLEYAQLIWNNLCIAFGGASQLDTDIIAKAIWGQMTNNNLHAEDMDKVVGHIAGLHADHWNLYSDEEARYAKELLDNLEAICEYQANKLAAEAAAYDFICGGNVEGYDL
jgi:hypothetical protein